MSDYYAKGRTNTFLVKDLDAFRADLLTYGITPATMAEAKLGAEFILSESPSIVPTGSIALLSQSTWPSFDVEHVAMRLGLNEDDELVPATYGTLQDLVAAHLVDGQVAIFLEVGSQKMAYLGGHAIAVNAAGETRQIDIADIYALGKELTTPDHTVTYAEN